MGTPRRSVGFTLLELLVVLFIMGLGWFALLPKLDFTRSGSAGKSLQQNMAFLDLVRESAVKTHSIQVIKVTLGSPDMTWGEKTQRLPRPLSSCQVNEKTSHTGGLSYSLRFFPDGHSDRALLTLENGDTLMLDPLSGAFKRNPATRTP